MYSVAFEAAEKNLNECYAYFNTAKLLVASGFNKVTDDGETLFDFEPLTSAWVDFVFASNRFFSKLEQGSKSGNSSKNWYGRVKHLRRTDELMRYMHQARHSSEHSLAPLSIASPSFEHPEGANVKITHGETPDGEKTIHVDIKDESTLKVTFDVSVTRIHNSKYNDFFDPPRTHKGEAVISSHPVNLMGI